MLPHEEYLQTPTSLGNCLAWSQDGFLAVAAQNEAHVLVPKRGSLQEIASSPWTHVSFDVTRFDSSEFTPTEQAPSTKMSIGEEQGESRIISVAWSPPGLAVHKRSALAVLTSNNVLSLWASSSDPAKSDSWARVLIVNEHHRLTAGAKIQPRSRVHAFAWADRLDGLDFEVPFPPQKKGLHILALAEDDSSIGLLLVDGPGRRNAPSWRVQRVAALSASEVNGWHDYQQDCEHGARSGRRRPPPRHSLFDASMGTGKRIDGIVLSPWLHHDAKFQSVLSIRAQSFMCHICLSVKDEPPLRDSTMSSSVQLECLNNLSLSTGNEFSFSDNDMAWHYFKAGNENGFGVACGQRFELHRLDTRPPTFTFDHVYAADLSGIEYDLEETFKLVAVCPASKGSEVSATKTLLYLVNSKSDIVTAELWMPFSSKRYQVGTLDTSIASPLKAQLRNCISRFSAQEKLGGSVCAKAKGIATWGSIIALCVTLAPDQEVELSNAADDNTVILFNTNSGTEEASTWPWELSLPMDPECTATSIIDASLDLDTLANTALNPISLRILYGLISLSLIIDDGLRSSRCRIAKKIIPKLQSFSGCSMEMETKLLSAFDIGERVATTVTISNIQQMMATTSKAFLTSSQTTEFSLLDMCPCCPSDAHLLWAADLQAQCERGHTFSRCCLTFLPIFNPQWSKVCAGCKREFINEYAHPEMLARCGPDRIYMRGEPSVEDRTEPAAPFGSGSRCYLANYLFEKFDQCPYCNSFYFG